MQSALFIGRFQPFHKGHLQVVKEILKTNDRVIIAIGSAELNFLPENPFTASERYQMIEESLQEAKINPKKYCIIPVQNINNYAIWVNHVNTYVPPYTRLYTGSDIVKACYDGKYSNSAKTGPEIINLDRHFDISATRVRKAIIEQDPELQKMIPPAIAKKLKEWDIAKRLRTIVKTMDYHKYTNESR